MQIQELYVSEQSLINLCKGAWSTFSQHNSMLGGCMRYPGANSDPHSGSAMVWASNTSTIEGCGWAIVCVALSKYWPIGIEGVGLPERSKLGWKTTRTCLWMRSRHCDALGAKAFELDISRRRLWASDIHSSSSPFRSWVGLEIIAIAIVTGENFDRPRNLWKPKEYLQAASNARATQSAQRNCERSAWFWMINCHASSRLLDPKF